MHSLRYYLTEINETTSTFFAMEERFDYFFRQLNVGPLSVSLKIRFPLSYALLSLVYTDPSQPLSLPVFQSGSFINASLILAAKRLVQPSIPREYTILSSFPPQMLLTFYPTHTYTYTSARLVSPTLPPSSLTYFFLTFFYSRFGQPHSQRIPSSLPPSIPPVAYIPISISIIAGELPASSGASQGCGLQMVFRRYFRFPLLPTTWCLFGCLVVSNDLPLFIGRRFSSTFSFPLPLCFSLFSILHRRRHFISFLSFCLIPAAFQH